MEGLKNKISLGDCMDFMRDMPDNYIDLAVVDPEYGINAGNMTMGKGKNKKWLKKNWDKKRPDKNYFVELQRISKNQIIWGGNYFADFLPISGGWIFWDKDRRKEISFSDGELAWTNFLNVLKKCTIKYDGFLGLDPDGRIHPTQKPIKLYRWILQNYAKPNQLILDTHSGSGSLACACHLEKYDFIAIEKDIDYFNDSTARLNELRSQGTLF